MYQFGVRIGNGWLSGPSKRVGQPDGTAHFSAVAGGAVRISHKAKQDGEIGSIRERRLHVMVGSMVIAPSQRRF